MLIKCPECELQVSDKAVMCPHCGYPLKPEKLNKLYKPKKRKRLPNGFGQISKLKNPNLRKPYRAMITIGFDPDTGKPICKPLQPQAYFETYNDAYAALVKYNKDPNYFENSPTVSEVYEKWFEYHYKDKKETSKKNIVVAWRYCSQIYNMKISDVRVRHLKSCINDGVFVVDGVKKKPTEYNKIYMKVIFNKLFDYAMEYELVDKNYGKMFSFEPNKAVQKTKKPHIPFTESEMEKLWANVNKVEMVDFVLIQCYSGWRPAELCEIKLENINLKENWFCGGSKTDSGKNRKVPIHPKVKKLIEKRYKEAKKMNFDYLFWIEAYRSGGIIPMNYKPLNDRFRKIVKELELDERHRAHDGRKHFVTQAKKYGVDEFAIKYIVGHTITDITEKIYTERPFEWLQSEIEKIK